MSTVADLAQIKRMDQQIVTIQRDTPVAALARAMDSRRIGCLVVVDPQGRIAGLVTERDIVSKVVAAGKSPQSVTAAEIMTEEVISCELNTPLGEVHRIMTENSIRHLPIVQGRIPVAMISSRDILSHRLAQAERIAREKSALLESLEHQHPGISSLQTDSSGRIVI